MTLVAVLFLPAIYIMTMGLAGCIIEHKAALPMLATLTAAIILFGVVF